MRIFSAAIAIAAALAIAAAIASAQTSVPTVTVTASATDVTTSPTPVAPGATRFVFTGDQEAGVYLVGVKPGRTADEVIAAVRQSPDTSFEVADIVASASLTPGASRAITVEIKPDTSYLLVNDLGDDDNPDRWIINPLATGGAPTGATAPAPDAEVVMRDVRFAGDKRLPRNGTIRVRNIGWAPHIAIAAPLRSGARKAAVGRAIVGARQRALGRLLNFRNTVEVANLLTRGATADQEVRFARRGRYVMICFVEGHDRQGMYRFVNVR